MSGDQRGVRAHQGPPHAQPVLTLDIHRVLDLFARRGVRAEFRFDPDVPFVVTTGLRIEGGPTVIWRIGRDLLYQGLFSVSGLGDIQVWPSHLEERATAWLQLSPGGTAALFELPLSPLAEWLEYTYQLVPAGEELDGLDWDAVTASLLEDPEVPSD